MEVLAARIDRLPRTTGELLTIMACLGGEVELPALAVAGDRRPADLEEHLLPALEDGLLIMSRTNQTLRFRHDRIQQAAFARGAERLHLPVARRLAVVPDLAGAAAEQYLAAGAAPDDAEERAQVVALYRAAAAATRLSSNQALRERYLSAATALVDTTDTATLADLATEHHATLYALGRLDEADEVYRWLAEHRPDPLANCESVCAQIASLTIQHRPHEAVELGLSALRGLGLDLPGPDRLGVEIDEGVDRVYRWLADSSVERELQRPELADPHLTAQAKIINRLIPPAFFSEQIPVMAWMIGRAMIMWAEHGPSPSLVGPLAHIGFVTIPMRDDRAVANEAVGRILAVSEARGYEPDASQCRFLFALSSGHWFQPLEQSMRQGRMAREGLIRGGDQLNAIFTFYVSVPDALDCSATLEQFLPVVDSALAFAAHTGNDHIAAVFRPHRQLVRALCGQTHGLASLDDDEFTQAAHLAEAAHNPTATGYFHITRGILGLVTDNMALVAEASAAALVLNPYYEAGYVKTLSVLMHGISLAEQIRALPANDPQRVPLLAELDRQRSWMSARAAQMPDNAVHLAHLLNAERGWAAAEMSAAIAEFDAAREAVARVERPWHRALIAGRAAHFYTHHGAHLLAHHLRTEWWQALTRWGATAAAAHLSATHPHLAELDRGTTPAQMLVTPQTGATVLAGHDTQHSMQLPTQALDLLAVVRAGQVLSGETDLARLRERVGDVLGALSGADRVQMAVRDEATSEWLLPDPSGTQISLAQAGAIGLVPLAAIRYAQRTGQPLTINDVSSHDLCARERYADSHERSSLLVVPITSHGTQRAVLVLENSLARGAFTAERLEAVRLIAGQLTVAIDNALLYTSLERKVAQRTEALEHANHQLEMLTVTDALTGLSNRRRLEDTFETEWRKRLRTGAPLAIAMIDVDHFKKYNDHYGHLSGDECLRLVAGTLATAVRQTDVVARYGGEEFCIVMPDTDLAEACEAAERVRATVAALNLEHSQSPIGQVTVSIGVAATVPEPDTLPDFLLKSADTALYEAKNEGRNRIASHRAD